MLYPKIRGAEYIQTVFCNQHVPFLHMAAQDKLMNCNVKLHADDCSCSTAVVAGACLISRSHSWSSDASRGGHFSKIYAKIAVPGLSLISWALVLDLCFGLALILYQNVITCQT